MRIILSIPVLLLMLACQHSPVNSQPSSSLSLGTDPNTKEEALYHALFPAHQRYIEKAITRQRFKQGQIAPLIQQLKTPFSWKIAGTSVEGRNIYRVQYGTGPITVLLWSQMHGDEPTATMALLDIFNFLSKNDEFNPLRERLSKALTLVFVPMLNPDGAERFERRNALGIDLNRDALRLQSPESIILKNLRDELNAQWGFNLHDQSRYYSAGYQPKTAAVSFLAPAFNYAKEVNDVRGNAMRLIAGMNHILQQHIPGNVARYDDEFEPRAFGDNIQRWGTSTILIEAGALPGDPEKQSLRKIHFGLILYALDAIAQETYLANSLEAYEQIPFNKTTFHDLLIREAMLEKGGKNYVMDIAFRNSDNSSSISDMGDLSTFYGYQEIEAKGLKIVPGKVYPTVFADISAAKSIDALSLLRQGFTTLQLSKLPAGSSAQRPFKLVSPGKSNAQSFKQGQNPTFVLTKQGIARWAIVNGVAFDLEKPTDKVKEWME
jgi:hypothetical protein